MLRWQEIEDKGGDTPFKRVKVDGGWMVWANYGPGRPGTISFRVDPSHVWDGSSDEDSLG